MNTLFVLLFSYAPNIRGQKPIYQQDLSGDSADTRAQAVLLAKPRPTPKPSPGLYRNWSRYLKLCRVFVSPLGSQVPGFTKGVPDGDDAGDKLQLLAME